MTYIGLYSSGKGLAAITDSQATAGDEKDDHCQKLYTIGGNIYTGTGLALAIKETAKGLESLIGDKDMPPEELAKRALDIGMKTFDFSQPWARTHLHISGIEGGGKESAGSGANSRRTNSRAGKRFYNRPSKSSSELSAESSDDMQNPFRIYAVVLSDDPGIYDVGTYLFDGSGAPSVIEALKRDMKNGINPLIHTELDSILSFLYDTGMEAPESPGVNMRFQFGFTDSRSMAALYHPDVVIEQKPKSPSGNGDYRSRNDELFGNLSGVLNERYCVRQRYTEAFEEILYGRKGESIDKLLSRKDGLRKDTAKLIGSALGSKPDIASLKTGGSRGQENAGRYSIARLAEDSGSCAGTIYCSSGAERIV
ncbi:MAG: hypothetical protein R6U32_01300 [Candidatus Woesearchaeota archaeon]